MSMENPFKKKNPVAEKMAGDLTLETEAAESDRENPIDSNQQDPNNTETGPDPLLHWLELRQKRMDDLREASANRIKNIERRSKGEINDVQFNDLEARNAQAQQDIQRDIAHLDEHIAEWQEKAKS